MRALLTVALALLPNLAVAQGVIPPAFGGRFTFDAVFSPDNTRDVGASGASRPRNVYVGTGLFSPAVTVSGMTAGRVVYTGASGLLSSNASVLYNGTTFESIAKTNLSGPVAATNVEIGSADNDAYGGTGGLAVVIGNGATNTANGYGAVVIGSSAAALNNSQDSIAIGRAAQALGQGSIVIGDSASTSIQGIRIGGGGGLGWFSSITLGYAAASSAPNRFVAGSGGSPMDEVYFGKGESSSTATPYVISGTPALGGDTAGGDLRLRGGPSTGSGRSGNTVIQGAPSGASGSTLNADEDRFYVVSKVFDLTDNTVATFATMALGNDLGGGGTISYCVISRNATTFSQECGEVDYNGGDATAGAGGEVCPNPTKQGTPLQALSGATLTVSFTATTGTDLCNLRVTADTNVTSPTALYIAWNASNPGGRRLTAQ
jgi:hypothetical protein